MALLKLLPSITIDSTNDRFSFTQSGTQNADMDADEYDSILEVCGELEDQLQAIDVDMAVTVSEDGIVVITSDNAWTTNWSGCDTALKTLLGFAGSESVAGAGPYVLTATKRHTCGLYPPVGGQWPADRRRVAAREQETDAGGLTQYTSTAEHRYRTLTLSLLSEAQMEAGGTDSDGDGGTVDWTDRTVYDFWKYIRDRPFRFYADRSDGTVASPGTEGTEYVTCRRFKDDWEPEQPDPGSWAYFNVTLNLKVVGGN